MNGRTTVVAKAAQIAIRQKGMIIVSSAGNEGDNKNWKVISSPSDVNEVIAVGALDKARKKFSFSSEGPSSLSYIKPDVACFSSIGTSGSAPIITGLIACMLQKKPSLTAVEIRALLHQSAHLYPYANNYVGYGVPNAALLVKLLNGEKTVLRSTTSIKTLKNEIVFTGDEYKNTTIVLFHKSSSKTTISQEEMTSNGNKFKATRMPKEQYTTVVVNKKVIEIEWKQ